MPFSHYDRRIHLPSMPTTVGIHVGGSLAFHGATDRAMGEAPYALLYFDDQRFLIGIDPVGDRTLASYAISRRPDYGGGRIHMRAFLSFLGIDLSIPHRLHAVFDNSRLVIDPSQPANLPVNPDRFLAGSFQPFEERRSALRGASTATINPRGVMSFSRPAYEAMGKPNCVEIYYDHTAERIGIEPVFAPTGSSYKVSVPNEAPHISCRNFLAYSQIVLSVSTRYAAVMEDGKLVINLRAPSISAMQRAGVVGIFKRDTPQPILRLVTANAKAS